MVKLIKNNKGFSLTEVMIGITILTIAIVTASSLLMSLIKSNKINVFTLKAYYLAQEGIEGVRNIRDTNWLHNLDFDSGDGVYPALEKGKTYSLFLRSEGWAFSDSAVDDVSKDALKTNYLPWEFKLIEDTSGVEPKGDYYLLQLNEYGDGHFYSGRLGEESIFYRHIDILDPCAEEEVYGENCDDFLIVRSVVNFEDREIYLEELLSNWKGGAL